MQKDVIEGLAAIVTDALSVALCRLEINDYDGEEQAAMDDVSAGLAAMRDLAPIIAAAPAMLAALREILAAYDGPHRGDYGAQSDAVFYAIEATGARDLIAAATGAPTDETGAAAPTDEKRGGIVAGAYRLEPHADGESVRVICEDGRRYAVPADLIERGIMDALDSLDDETETDCASCGAPEGESHGAGCEARGFAMGVAAAIGER